MWSLIEQSAGHLWVRLHCMRDATRGDQTLGDQTLGDGDGTTPPGQGLAVNPPRGRGTEMPRDGSRRPSLGLVVSNETSLGALIGRA